MATKKTKIKKGKRGRFSFPFFGKFGKYGQIFKKDFYNENDITLLICKSQICE